jgi:hypothetical protein
MFWKCSESSAPTGRADRLPERMKGFCAMTLAVSLLALTGCGLIESESGQHFAEKNVPVPSADEVETTLNHFEKAFREKQDYDACKFLTPRSLREFVAAEGKDPGHLSAETFKRGCPLYLRTLSKGVKVPPVRVEIDEVIKEEFKDQFYLVAYPPRGPSVVMSVGGTKIAIFAGPEKGE